MRFRKFIEITSPGFMTDRVGGDSPNPQRPELDGATPAKPQMDRVMQTGSDEVQGQIMSINNNGDRFTLDVRTVSGKEETIIAPAGSLQRHGKDMPRVGDSIRCVVDRQRMLQDYDILP
jgi:hypothetical protein